eukprot:EG_transcript_18720
MVNRVFGAGVMTGKGAFYNLLRSQATPPPGLSAQDMHPATYCLYLRPQCQAFFASPKPGVWIVKQTHTSNGFGVRIVDDAEQLREEFGGCTAHNYSHVGYVVQRYIPNPLLLQSRKSEVRAYWLIACTAPWIVLYHRGTVRLNSEPFAWHSFGNRWMHVTNVAQQKSHPRFAEPGFQEGLKWSYDDLDEYLAQERIAPAGWVANVLEPTMKRYLRHVFRLARPALRSVPGTFGLFAADFLIDDTLRVFITEVQNGPDLTVQGGGPKATVVRAMLREAVAVVMEVLHRTQRGLPLSPLDSLQHFEVLVHDAHSTPAVNHLSLAANDGSNGTT